MGNCLEGFWIEIERKETIPKCVLCEEAATVTWGEMSPNEQHQWTWKNLTAYHTVCLVDEKIKSQQKEEFFEHLKFLKSKKFPRNRWVPQLKKISSGTEWHGSMSFMESDLLMQTALAQIPDESSDSPKYNDNNNNNSVANNQQSQNGGIQHEHRNGQLKEDDKKLISQKNTVQVIEEESEDNSVESQRSTAVVVTDTPTVSAFAVSPKALNVV